MYKGGYGFKLFTLELKIIDALQQKKFRVRGQNPIRSLEVSKPVKRKSEQ
jgi:hypothetical protein